MVERNDPICCLNWPKLILPGEWNHEKAEISSFQHRFMTFVSNSRGKLCGSIKVMQNGTCLGEKNEGGGSKLNVLSQIWHQRGQKSEVHKARFHSSSKFLTQT